MRAVAEELEQVEVKASSCSLLSGSCGLTHGQISNSAQGLWAAIPLTKRLKVLKAARHRMASLTDEFAAAISLTLARTKADTLVTELLPLLDACKFLEREAKRILSPRKLSSGGRPFWLAGVVAEVHREPLGHVLILGPANFPLFLPGVQALQALAAGNTVTWKPGDGGAAVANLFARAMAEAGLPAGVLRVTDESVEAAQAALASGPDKVIFTGSSRNGSAVLSALAEHTIPAIVELSGADAILVMPSADLTKVAKAVAFGLRLNGGAVCMSPRRLIASQTALAALKPLLEVELSKVPAVVLEKTTTMNLKAMLEEAVAAGAVIHGELDAQAQRPIVVSGVQPGMRIASSDIFAPVISLLRCESMLHALEQYALCPYALTASIFCGKGDEKKARAMAKALKAGTVLINDVIAPTADPRIPFGGRGASGFGVTRGAEGLLEMTAIKTLLVRRGGAMRHLDATREEDTAMFAGLIGAVHGGGLAERWNALRKLMGAGRTRT
jgi:acyl-CoA reductase-like NAD-dependent aldehyde dehydrogenase